MRRAWPSWSGSSKTAKTRVPAVVVVDSGPLVAAAIRTDPDHDRCVAFFETSPEAMVVPQLAVGETAYMVGRIGGTAAEVRLLRELEASSLVFEPFEPSDLRRIATLVETYADLHLGSVDASVIATAERIDAATIATLDRRHFTVVRPSHVDSFQLVPSPSA